MENGLTKFVLLIDYHGEYTLKHDNEATKQYIYDHIDGIECIEQMTCKMDNQPSNVDVYNYFLEHEKLKKEIERLKVYIVEIEDDVYEEEEEGTIEFENEIQRLKKEHEQEIQRLKKEHAQEKQRLTKDQESHLSWSSLQKEHYRNNVEYLEGTIHNLENKLSVQDDLIAELQEQEKISIDLFCETHKGEE